MSKPGGAAFGMPDADPTEKGIDLSGDPFENLPTIEEKAPEQAARPEPAPVPAPEAPAPEPAPEPQAEKPEEKPDEYEYEGLKNFLGGKYRTLAEAEAGWNQVRSMRDRTFNENREKDERLRQYEEAFQRVRPIIEREMHQQKVSVDDVFTEADPDRQKEAFQRLVDQTVQERVSERIAPIEQERLAQDAAQREEVSSAFYASHPDVEKMGDLDQSLGRYLKELWMGPEGEDPDNYPMTRENLEAAYKAVKDPKVQGLLDDLELYPNDSHQSGRQMVDIAAEVVQNPAVEKLVRAMPALLESPGGLEWAREQATASLPQKPTGEPDEAARRAANFSETGPSGSPVQAAPGLDPAVQAIFDLAREDEKGKAFRG